LIKETAQLLKLDEDPMAYDSGFKIDNLALANAIETIEAESGN